MQKLKWKNNWTSEISEGAGLYLKNQVLPIANIWRTKYIYVYGPEEGNQNVYKKRINEDYNYWKCQIKWPITNNFFQQVWLTSNAKFKKRWQAKLEVERMIQLITNNTVKYDSEEDVAKYNWHINQNKYKPPQE